MTLRKTTHARHIAVVLYVWREHNTRITYRSETSLLSLYMLQYIRTHTHTHTYTRKSTRECLTQKITEIAYRFTCNEMSQHDATQYCILLKKKWNTHVHMKTHTFRQSIRDTSTHAYTQIERVLSCACVNTSTSTNASVCMCEITNFTSLPFVQQYECDWIDHKKYSNESLHTSRT